MDDHTERVRRRAYQIWLEEGRPEGREAAHWEMARELVAIEDSQTSTTRPVERNPDDPESAATPSKSANKSPAKSPAKAMAAASPGSATTKSPPKPEPSKSAASPAAKPAPRIAPKPTGKSERPPRGPKR
jgi:hypothetical protein